MRRQEIEATLAAAYPLDRERVEGLDIEALEADLLADIDDLEGADGLLGADPMPAGSDAEGALADAGAGATPRGRTRGWLPRSRRLGLGLAGAALAAVVLAVVLLGGGGGERPSSAYGAELIRYAESSPLLLVDGPGWGVQNVGHLSSTAGYIDFGKKSPDPHPDEPLETRAEVKRHETPPAVIARALRFMQLAWRNGRASKIRFHDGRLSVSLWSPYEQKVDWMEMPGRSIKTTIPALGVTAYVDPHTERSWRQGPGHRSMVAVWEERGRLVELRAEVPDLATFRERLGWLRRVSAEEWLDAMPPRIVKSVDYVATVEAMLEGIPQPPGFDPTKLEEGEVTTDRYQVGAAVGGAVACSWFRVWGEALASGDTAGAEEAESVLRGAGSWPIFEEMAKEGAYPATILEYAEAMPSRRWYGRPLLPQLNKGLCKTNGYPAIAAGG